ncbi:MAG: molybdenum cofactor guanylyltransferase [Proteobacteria bacterium]|nr:molybdenum cofactor guanylyltransferase [Pseudomonadota bacterium]
MAEAPLHGLVLAGGRSRRMGRDKALLERDGRSQLAWIVALLDAHLDRVFVSTRADQRDDTERARFAQIVDRHDDLGPLAGILSAMEEYPSADWLVVACDLPNVSGETVRYLITNRSDEHPFTAFVSSHDGLPEPLCAIWRAGTGDIVRAFVDDGVICPRKILIRSDTHLIEQADPASLDNVNTPEDLAVSVLESAS